MKTKFQDANYKLVGWWGSEPIFRPKTANERLAENLRNISPSLATKTDEEIVAIARLGEAIMTPQLSYKNHEI